jgi:hypothetical protein
VLVPGTRETYRTRFTAANAGAPWTGRVHFHGAVSDERLARFYAGCDVFVAPSLLESFGLIYAEAMQYGKPVVGCRAGGIPELVRDGIDGFVVEPGSVDALEATLDRLMSDPELRERLGRAGRARIADELDHRAMAARFVDVYERVAAESRSGRARSPDGGGATSGPDAEALRGVLDTLAAYVTTPPSPPALAPAVSRLQRIRELLQQFRREPVGGRLLPLKRLVYWFTASAFDRQTKVQEAMVSTLVEIEREVAELGFRTTETSDSKPPDRSPSA